MTTETLSIRRLLRPALPGLLCAALTILYGFGLGVVFGLNEDLVKSRMKESAAKVKETAYRNDEAAVKTVLDKSWAYMKRAHLHAGALGTTSIAISVLVALLGASPWMTRAISLGSGAGGLGYAIYWMLAGFRAPGLGGTTAAKESLAWLAIPSSAAVTLAVVALVYVLVSSLLHRSGDE